MAEFPTFRWDGNRYRMLIQTPEQLATMREIYDEDRCYHIAKRYEDERPVPCFGFRVSAFAEDAESFEEWARSKGIALS